MSRRRQSLIALLLAALCLSALADAAPNARFTEGYLPQFSYTVRPADRARIAIRADYPADFAVKEWPVTFGVPFPRGALKSARNVRIVTAGGQEVPAQILRTGTWVLPDGDVKWVLIDMTAKRGEQYFVEYGTRVRRREFAGPLKVSETADRILVTTGPLQVGFSKKRSHLIDGAWRDADGDARFSDGEKILAAHNRMWMLDQNGVRYETSDRPADYKLEVETRGPRRVVVKATGFYRDLKGRKLCEYVTRFHLYAGTSHARLIHTFVVHYDTDKTWLRDVAVPLDFTIAGARSAVFSTGTGLRSPSMTAPVPSYLVQEATNRFSVKTGDGRVLRKGKRVGGWVDVLGPRGGVAVGLRNMWRDWQKELEARPDGVVIHLWPRHSGRFLDFRAPAVYGPERYKRLDGLYWRNWYVGGLDKYDQAMGIAKTNEMIIAFHGRDATEARAVAAVQEKPPFLTADPAWMCKTDVFGPLHPRDMKRYADLERKFEIAFGRFQFLRDHLDNYGFWDYGDVNYVTNFDAKTKRFRERPWRRMASRFYGISLMPWIQYVRTGDRVYRRWAMDNAKHVMDIDMTHVTAKVPGYRYPKYKGGRFGGNGGIINYGANCYPLGCDSHVTPWLYYYYLTGYRRGWDVFLEEGDYYLKAFKEKRCGLLTRYAHRMSGGGIRVMIQYWWATWKPAYLECARKMAETCYDAAKKSDGVIRHDDVYMNRGLVTYYQATGDERMKKIHLANMRALQSGRMTLADPRAYTFYGPAMAYYFTGDSSYLRRPLGWMMDYERVLNTGDDPLRRGIPEGHWDMCHNTVQLLYMPHLLGALATLEKPITPAAVSDNTATSTEIWLNNPTGQAVRLRVRYTCYTRPYFCGVSVGREWQRYCASRKPAARVVVLDPQDRVVASAAIPLAKKATGGAVTLQVPAGGKGMYRVAAEGAEAMPLRLSLAESPLDGRVYPADRGAISLGNTLILQAPKHRPTLKLKYKLLALRVRLNTALYDSQGKALKKALHKLGSSPLGTWVQWTVPVPPAERGKLWKFEIRPVTGKLQETLLRLDGTAPAVSTSKETFFAPDRVPAPRDAKPLPRPAGVNEPVITVAAKKTLKIARGRKLGKLSYERLNAEQGTLEFWMRPDWDADDISDSTFVKCGGMRVYRRSQVGTYIGLAGGITQAGYWLKPYVWSHVAVTWDFRGPVTKHKVRLYVNGMPFGGKFRGRKAPGDWTGKALEIGSNADLQITGLRVWGKPRDKELSQRKLSPAKGDALLYSGAK